MTDVQLVDVSLRDGNQSLWGATGLRTEHIVQIAPLLNNGISPTELRAMLTMEQAQLAQSLREEESRLRHIESRIAQIDRRGGIGDYDVVVKQVAATPFMSLR